MLPNPRLFCFKCVLFEASIWNLKNWPESGVEEQFMIEVSLGLLRLIGIMLRGDNYKNKGSEEFSGTQKSLSFVISKKIFVLYRRELRAGAIVTVQVIFTRYLRLLKLWFRTYDVIAYFESV